MEGFAINVFGPIRVMHAFLPLLRQRVQWRRVVPLHLRTPASPAPTSTTTAARRPSPKAPTPSSTLQPCRRTGRPAPSRTGTARFPGGSGTETDDAERASPDAARRAERGPRLVVKRRTQGR